MNIIFFSCPTQSIGKVNMKRLGMLFFTLFCCVLTVLILNVTLFAQANSSPFYDYSAESPGKVHKITPSDLPKPFASKSANNFPVPAARPEGALPKALPGFKVDIYATGLDEPRKMLVAPNGDIFLAETSKGEITVFRGVKDGKPEQKSTFASGLHEPFGIAFYPPGKDPQWVYIGDTDSVKRFAYHNGDLKATGQPQNIVAEIFPGAAHAHGHSTRDVAFSPDGKKMFVSVGSASNVDDPDTHKTEFHRANVLEYNPDGSGLRVFASGIRNPVGLAINPKTANFGLRRTNATRWATISFPTTPRMFRTAASMAGPGITWAAITIRACQTVIPI